MTDETKTGPSEEEVARLTEEILNSPEPKVICWSCNPDAEVLGRDPDQAILDYLDEYLDRDEETPETVILYGYARMPVKVDPEQILEDIIERLDEEYGDPDGNFDTPISDDMKKAAQYLAAVVERDYESWACYQVSETTIDVKKWEKGE